MSEENSPSSVDSQDQSTISSAIESAAESASTYAHDATESLTENATAAKDSVVDSAQGMAAAGGMGFAPQGDRRRRDDRPAQARAELTPTSSIYIGNLLFEITPADLEREFKQFGVIEKCVIASDNRGLSKGFGYVTFTNVDEATKAIEGMNQVELEGRRLIVNYQAQTQRPTRKNEPSKTLFIGNLAFEMSDADLNKLFRDIRNVIDVRVAIDRRTGQPRGFAHADFVDTASAEKAYELLQGKEVYGRRLRCDYSDSGNKSREPRIGGRDGASGGWREGRSSF